MTGEGIGSYDEGGSAMADPYTGEVEKRVD
jgi:hypothetical protein